MIHAYTTQAAAMLFRTYAWSALCCSFASVSDAISCQSSKFARWDWSPLHWSSKVWRHYFANFPLKPQGAHPGYSPERMVRNGQKLEEILVFLYLSNFFPPPLPISFTPTHPHPAREFRAFPRGTGDETIVSPRVFGRFGPFFRENIQGGLPVLKPLNLIMWFTQPL